MKKEPQNLKTAIESLRNATQEFHRHIEVLPLLEAQDRILAETICAKISLPRFDNSAMDGYALKVANAGKKIENPIKDFCGRLRGSGFGRLGMCQDYDRCKSA